MSQSNNKTVKGQLTLLVAVAAAGILVLAFVAQMMMGRVFDAANYATVNVVPSLSVLDKTRSAFGALRVRVYRLAMNNDSAKWGSLEESIQEAAGRVGKSLKEYEALVSDEQDKQLMGAVRTDFERYMKDVPLIVAAAKAGRDAELRAELEKIAKESAQKLGASLDKHYEYNMELAHKGELDAQAAKQSALWISLIIAGGTLAVLVLVGMGITRALLRQLGGEPSYAAEITGRIAQGDLGTTVQLAAGDHHSMLAAMSHMQNELRVIVSDIQQLVNKAVQGDFTQRIDVKNKQGFGRDISEALNKLNSDLQRQIGGNPAEAVQVASRIAAGDLSVQVNVLPNDSQSILAAMSRMRDTLSGVMNEVRDVVDGAANGDFSRQMDASTKQGYARTLSELLNRLSMTANEGLTDITRVAQALANGDLTQRIEKSYPGLFGQTANGMNATVDNLKELIVSVVDAVEAINTAAKEIATGNQDLSSRTEMQASSLEETAASMEELTSMVQQNTQNARHASELASESSQVANRGGEVVNASVQTMADIADSSRKISEIIGVIDGIAFQTNILALNAAVEAARAGEQGRGFAVVASEVRNLALRAAGAAKEIKDLITESVGKVERGTHQAEEAGKTMNEIVTSINQVSRIIADISSASGEQSSGIGQVGQAVAEMDQVTQQNAALVEEAAAAAESLVEQANQLQRLVSRFKLDHQQRAHRHLASVEHHAPVEHHERVRHAPAPRVAKAPAAKPVSKPQSKPASKPVSKPAPRKADPVDSDDDWAEF